MNKLLTLTKAFLFSSFNFRKKKGKPNSILLIGILFLGISIFYNYMLILSVEELGIDYNAVFLVMCVFCSFLTLMFSFSIVHSAIFSSKDYEFVESLPVSKFSVVAARVLSLIIITIAEDVLILTPAIVFNIIYTSNLLMIPIGILSILFVGTIPLLIASLIGALIVFLTKKSKNKTLVQTIVYAMIMLLAFSMSFMMNGNNMNSLPVNEIISALPYMSLLNNALNGNILHLLLFVGINIVAYILVMLFISALYRPLNNIKQRVSHESYNATNDKGIDIKKALDHKERKMILNNPNYLINAFTGQALFIISGLAMIFISTSGIEDVATYQEVTAVMCLIIPGFGILMNGIMNSTCSSISLEGKSFEQLLTYPINPSKLIKAKIKAGIMIPLIINLVSFIVLGTVITIKLGFNILVLLELLILPNLSLVACAFIGIIINLKHPKIDFEADIQVIKQSKAVLITMLITMIPSMLFMGIIIACNIITQYTGFPVHIIGFGVVTIILVVEILLANSWINEKGNKYFYDVINK